MKPSEFSQRAAQPLLPRFGDGFLEDHARKIIGDPKIALVELVANCWDAGADRVDVKWPIESTPELIEIKDNGTGMSYDEFVGRWLELNYNRKQAQGEEVVFPVDNQASHRKAFGRNGKGRHSMFCFASEYFVETWKDGQCNRFSVKRSSGTTTSPFMIEPQDQFSKEGHGTIVSAELVRNYLSVPVVHDLIGSKFVADPTFKIFLNEEPVELTDLEHLFDVKEVVIPDMGKG